MSLQELKIREQDEQAKTATQRYNKALANLREFAGENADVLAEFMTLVSALDNAAEDAKTTIQELPADSGWEYGGFTKNKSAVSVTYAANKIPKAVLELPGVIKSVDTAMLEKHLASSPISTTDRAKVMAARSEKVAKAVVKQPAKSEGVVALLEVLL